MSEPAPPGHRGHWAATGPSARRGSTDVDNRWLAAGSAELLQPPQTRNRRLLARDLGARAADVGVDLRDVVTAILAAASSHWTSQDGAPAHPATSVRAEATDLLNLLEELVGAAVDGYHQQARSELTRFDTERAAFLRDLLTGGADPGGLAERAQRYGIRLSADHTVIIARGPGLTGTLIHRIDEALATRYGEGNILTTRRDQDLVCISAGGLRGLPAELARHLVAHLGAEGWQIGVGRSHPGLPGLATSLDEASSTLDLATRLGFTTPVLHAADLLVFPVLLRDRDAITDLVTTVLGPLTKARGGAQPYLNTLSVLFDNQGNYTAAARELHLSVRAVTYRLDRIRAITGYHPGEPTQRFTLQTAVLGARLLGWPPT